MICVVDGEEGSIRVWGIGWWKAAWGVGVVVVVALGSKTQCHNFTSQSPEALPGSDNPSVHPLIFLLAEMGDSIDDELGSLLSWPSTVQGANKE